MANPSGMHEVRVRFGEAMTRNLVFVVLIPFLLIFAQLIEGAEPMAAVALGGCTSLAVLAFLLAGGFRSYLGILLLVWAGKIFLFAIAAKVLIGESTTATLEAPTATATVYLLGWSALLAAVLLQHVLPTPRADGILPRIRSPRTFLVLSIFLLVAGIILPLLIGDNEGNVGLFRAIASLRDFCVLSGIFWGASLGKKRPYLHPWVLTCLVLCVAWAMTGNSKESFLTPLAVYFVGVLLFGGARNIMVYVGLGVVAISFQFVIGPMTDITKYTTYAANETYFDRIKTILKEKVDLLKDPQYVRTVRQDWRASYQQMGAYYFEADVGYLERASLIKTGDKLVAATALHGTTGWKTILWDLSCFPPRFISPNKPFRTSSNQLALFTGQIAYEDQVTTISYGVFPHLFHALGYAGVFFLGTVTFALLFWWFRIAAGGTRKLTFYGILLVGMLHHQIAEDIFAGILFLFYAPVILMLVVGFCRLLSFEVSVRSAPGAGPI